jgi:DNA-binding NtrC family response regulator
LEAAASGVRSDGDRSQAIGGAIPIDSAKGNGGDADTPSLAGDWKARRLSAEREAIERVLTQTRWNRRQAAKILKISYKALLNKLKAIEEQNAQNKNLTA